MRLKHVTSIQSTCAILDFVLYYVHTSMTQTIRVARNMICKGNEDDTLFKYSPLRSECPTIVNCQFSQKAHFSPDNLNFSELFVVYMIVTSSKLKHVFSLYLMVYVKHSYT